MVFSGQRQGRPIRPLRLGLPTQLVALVSFGQVDFRFVDEGFFKNVLRRAGGKRSERFSKGYFFEPTVLTNLSMSAKIMTEEPFAPVMPLLDFSKLDDVIQAANNTRYGLAAYVFTNDLSVAWKMAEGIEAGIIGINDPVPATPQCPFGGMKESGMGRELSHEGLEAYLETKYVSFKLRD